MAYGDNRNQLASDTFNSAISASWDNPSTGYTAMQWVSGGHIEATNGSTNCAIVRNAETFAANQYSSVTVQTHAELFVGAVCRQQAADGARYVGFGVASGSTGKYEIWEYSTVSGATLLAQTGTMASISTGDVITLEAEGTALRFGAAEGGPDTQRTTTTDNTLASGRPGCAVYVGTIAAARITAWAGGNIEVASTGPRMFAKRLFVLD